MRENNIEKLKRSKASELEMLNKFNESKFMSCKQ